MKGSTQVIFIRPKEYKKIQLAKTSKNPEERIYLIKAKRRSLLNLRKKHKEESI